jgi:hypothetical protein
MPKSRRRVRKPTRQPSAGWRTPVGLLDTWIKESAQGQQLLANRTLAEAREAVLELLAQGLLDMQVTELPGDQLRIEIWPTSLAPSGGADAPQASQAPSAR